MLITSLILILATTILLATLLTKPKAIASSAPILRWNETGITVAGVTGQFGNASNKLYYPFGLVVDWSNTLYIADRFNNRIQKYLKDASFGETVAGQASGVYGGGSSFLNLPAGVQVDSNANIYVADTNNYRVQLWKSGSSAGITIAGVTGMPGNSSNQLDRPFGIARDSISGAIYVADAYNHRVMYYPLGVKNGTLVAGGNGAGVSNTQLNYPRVLYFDVTSNSLLIADSGANNVVRWVLGASNWILVAGNLNGTSSAASTGLSNPSGVTLDPMGNTYVADFDNQRIQFFPIGETSGRTIAGKVGLVGNTTSLLHLLNSIALDNQLNLYVSDSYNHRVQKFMRY